MKPNEGPYRIPEKPKKTCADPFGKKCVKPATVTIRGREVCYERFVKFVNDAGLMG